MTKLGFIKEDDIPILQQMIAEYRRHNREGDIQPHILIEEEPADDIFTPEVYVAKTPVGGIPALEVEIYPATGSIHYVPGKARCDIYKLWPRTSLTEQELIATIYDQLVYNVSQHRIDSLFKIVWRDKYGDWVTDCGPCELGTGTGTTGTGSTGTGSTGTGSTGTGTTGTGTTGTGTTGTGTASTGTGTVEEGCFPGDCWWVWVGKPNGALGSGWNQIYDACTHPPDNCCHIPAYDGDYLGQGVINQCAIGGWE